MFSHPTDKADKAVAAPPPSANDDDSDDDNDPKSSFAALFWYSTILLAMPIVTYIVGKNYVFEQYWGLDSATSSIYWAISAVVGIHLVLGSLIFKCYRQIPSKPAAKMD